MNKKILIILYSIIISFMAWSNNRISLTLSYYGETITHPGLMFGAEYNLLESNSNEISFFVNLGSYRHHRNHISAFINSGVSYRYTFESGFNINSSLGIGYLHKFLDGDIYVLEDGDIKKIQNLGSASFMPLFDIGVGWDLSSVRDVPIDLFIKTQVFGEYSLNSMIIPHISFVIGTRVMLKGDKNNE